MLMGSALLQRRRGATRKQLTPTWIHLYHTVGHQAPATSLGQAKTRGEVYSGTKQFTLGSRGLRLKTAERSQRGLDSSGQSLTGSLRAN